MEQTAQTWASEFFSSPWNGRDGEGNLADFLATKLRAVNECAAEEARDATLARDIDEYLLVWGSTAGSKAVDLFKRARALAAASPEVSNAQR